MPAGSDRKTVGTVRGHQHRCSRHICGARECERIDSASCDREEASVQMRDHDLSRTRHHQTRVKGSVLARTFGPNITRFVNVLAKPLRHLRSGPHRTSNIKLQTSQLPVLPLSLPSPDDWLLQIIEIRERFVLGLYRRHMKAINYLGKIEKLLGVPATNRNWNTILKVAQILSQD